MDQGGAKASHRELKSCIKRVFSYQVTACLIALRKTHKRCLAIDAIEKVMTFNNLVPRALRVALSSGASHAEGPGDEVDVAKLSQYQNILMLSSSLLKITSRSKAMHVAHARAFSRVLPVHKSSEMIKKKVRLAIFHQLVSFRIISFISKL